MTTDQQAPDEFADLADLMQDEQDIPPGSRGPLSPEARRARRRRLLAALVVVALLLAAAGGYTGWALTAPLPTPVEASDVPRVAAPAAAALTLPVDGAAAISVSGAEEYLGAEASGIWAASGGNEPRPLASITKLIAALVILDRYPLAGADDPGPTITFSKADHDLYDEYYVMGATIAAMPTGTRMPLRDALATMLIPSASNYADAVSTWAFGSRWGFAEAARSWLAKNGLTGTTVVEPTGVSRDNTSTPTDLIAIGKLAAANPAIAKIARTSSINLAGPGLLYNTNGLLGTPGITGLKTGNLGAGSHNLLFTASVDVGSGTPLAVVGVVLGGATRQAVNTDVVLLLDSLRAGFHEVPVATQGDVVGTYETAWGDEVELVISENASIFTWSDTPITGVLETTAPAAYEDGEVVGTITWTAGPQTQSVDVEIQGSIEPPDAWWRLTNPELLGEG